MLLLMPETVLGACYIRKCVGVVLCCFMLAVLIVIGVGGIGGFDGITKTLHNACVKSSMLFVSATMQEQSHDSGSAVPL